MLLLLVSLPMGFPPISKRWETLYYLFTGVLINYCLRVNMSIAASEIIDNLHWSDYQKGFLLSSFFWGYSVGQIPCTLIAQKYGHKYTFGLAVLLSSLITLLLPAACTISFGYALTVRALTGLMSSALFPSSYHFFPRWIPLNEKTIMISIFGSGMYMGEIIGFSVSGYLVGTDSKIKFGNLQIGGWPSAFYFFGIIGLLWTPFYFWNVYGSPEEHPSISLEEKHLIAKGLVEEDVKYDIEYYQSEDESDGLLGHETGSIASHRVRSNSAQPELRKRVSSIGGAIASESLYASSNIENSLPHNDHQSLATQHQQFLFQQQSPLLSHDQLHTISTSKQSVASHKAMNDLTFSDIPWCAFATTPQALILFLCHWCYSFVGFILLTEIPAFLTDVLDYDIESAGLLSITPYAANFISTIIFAMYFDRVEVRSFIIWIIVLQEIEGWSARKVRQRSMQITFLGAGGCLVICGFMKQRGIFSATFMSLIVIF